MNEQDIIVKLTEHEGKIDRHEGRIKNLETNYSALNDMARNMALLTQQLKNTEIKVDVIDANVEELKLKGSKKWDALVEKILWAVVGAVIASLLSAAGL